MANIINASSGITYLITDYGETFVTGSAPIGSGHKSSSDKVFYPVKLPIKPVNIQIVAGGAAIAYDSHGHLFYASTYDGTADNDNGTNSEFVELSNLQEAITDVIYSDLNGDYTYFDIATNNKIVSYSANCKGNPQFKETILDLKIDKYRPINYKQHNLSYTNIVLSNNRLYFGVENRFVGVNFSGAISHSASLSSPVLNNIRNFCCVQAYTTSNSLTTSILVIGTDNKIKVYQAEDIDVSQSSTLKFSDFQDIGNLDITENIINFYDTYHGNLSVSRVQINEIVTATTSSPTISCILQTSDKMYYITNNKGKFSITKTIYTNSNSVPLPYFQGSSYPTIAIPNSGVIRWLETASKSKYGSNSLYDTDSQTITFPSKINKIYYGSKSWIVLTADNKIYTWCSNSNNNNALYINDGDIHEITTFNIGGAGYAHSQLRTTLTKFESCLPEDLQNVITTIPKKTSDIISTVNIADYSHVLTSNVVETNDKIFTLSEHEVLGTNKSYSFTVNGKTVPQSSDKNYQTQYAYYANGAHSLKRVAHNDPNTEVEWWTRTPYLYTDSQGVQRVFSSSFKTGDKTDATARPNATNQRKSLGIVPCFGIAADIT